MAERQTITGARTIWELVSRRAEATPDHPMLIDAEGTTLSFGAFCVRAERVAAGLAARGVGEGSVVSWQLPSRIDTVLLSIALSRLGAVQNPIIHLYREREVGFALRQTGSELFCVQKDWRGIDFVALAERALEGATTKPELLVVDRGLPEADPAALAPPPVGTGAEDAPIRWIYYTSGSTADPKGVRHTDQTLIAGGWGLAVALDMSPDDVGSIAFPFAHIAGPDYLVTMLSLGFPAVIVEAFSAPEVLPIFRRHGRPWWAGAPPSTWPTWPSSANSRANRYCRRFASCRAAVPPNHSHPLRGTRRNRRSRGGPRLRHDRGADDRQRVAPRHRRAAGEHRRRPGRGAEVRIVTLDGAVAGPDEEGEIRVRGPMVFHGYTDPSLDTEAFDTDGFFRTGDLGKLRADGHLIITGRLKDVIVRKGENVSATEVEAVLYTHSKVAEVAVIGLPDKDRGERVCAVVQLVEGAEPLTLAELVTFVARPGS